MENMKAMNSSSSTRHHGHDHQHRSGGGGGGGGTESGVKRLPAIAAAMTTKMKRATVVYYLSRNGQLEHPHFTEVSHPPNLPLRLKDVMDRLTALRGKGMPSMYSWSCKRSYKNGYVWNDLSENDAIQPADGAEYVLKGSEIIDSCSERFQQINLSNRQMNSPETDQLSKRLVMAPSGLDYSRRIKLSNELHHSDEDHEYEGQEEYEEEEKTSYTSSTTPQSRCSRGISTDELEEHEPESKKPSLSPPSSTTSPTLISNQKPAQPCGGSSRRFSDKDVVDSQVVPRFALGRNSVLLQLISCGSTAGTMPKTAYDKDHSRDLHKGVVCRNAAKAAPVEDEAAMIVYMSENPRFGNLQSEEKEYFSGSIVESIRVDHDRAAAEPALKRSNSYNAERSSLAEKEEAVFEANKEKSTAKGKCIPRMISSSKITKKR